jgi:hypothetical protein
MRGAVDVLVTPDCPHADAAERLKCDGGYCQPFFDLIVRSLPNRERARPER